MLHLKGNTMRHHHLSARKLGLMCTVISNISTLHDGTRQTNQFFI